MSDSRADFDKWLASPITPPESITEYAWMAWQASRAQPERKLTDHQKICNDSRFMAALDGYMDAVTYDSRNTDRRIKQRLEIFAAAEAWFLAAQPASNSVIRDFRTTDEKESDEILADFVLTTIEQNLGSASHSAESCDQTNLIATSENAAQPEAATVPDDDQPCTLLTVDQWHDLNNVAFLLEHFGEYGMSEKVRSICDESEISATPPAAQPQDDGEQA